MRKLFGKFLRTVPEPEPEFTGNCMVRQYTGDGDSVGPCWYATYDGQCPLHGDVSDYLEICSEHEVDIWPADFNLPMYDDVPWAMALRARQEKGGHR